MSILQVVSAALFHGDHVLLIERAKDPYKGCWSLPGGRVESGETHEQAAIREIHEETGLNVTQLGFVHKIRFDLPAYELHVFVGQANIHEAVAQDDAADARAVLMNDVHKFRTTPNLQHSIEAARTCISNILGT